MTGTAADQQGLPRAALLAGVSTVLTAVGHLAGGGALPDLTVLVVLLPLFAGVVSTLAERSRSAVGTIAVLGAGQLALHQLIELFNPTHTAHHLVGTTGPSDAGMLAAHAVATLLTAAVLRFVDRAVAAIGAVLRRVVPRRLPALCADRPLATLVTPGAAVSIQLARVLAAAQVRRGPPVGC